MNNPNHSSCVCPNCKPELFTPEEVENSRAFTEKTNFILSVLDTTELVKELVVPVLCVKVPEQIFALLSLEHEIDLAEADIKLMLNLNNRLMDNGSPEATVNRINLENKIKDLQVKIQTAKQNHSELEALMMKENAAIARVANKDIPTFNGIPLPSVTARNSHKIH